MVTRALARRQVRQHRGGVIGRLALRKGRTRRRLDGGGGGVRYRLRLGHGMEGGGGVGGGRGVRGGEVAIGILAEGVRGVKVGHGVIVGLVGGRV